ncbi:MAG: NADPH-dependent glutamate synthase [Clostridia bacterium]|nr:NADPH-dependent glutamate synthase [Clostridia bacterium]
MINKSKEKEIMRSQNPAERIKNFDEVELGYDEETAVKEANRCLSCRAKPCVSACPIGIDIPEFISRIKIKDFKSACDVINKSNPFPEICGRVCPQEKQCERVCVRSKTGEPVAIGCLERFASKYSEDLMRLGETVGDLNNLKYKKVAVVGSGPSGLTCALELAKKGFSVTVFEVLHEFGGVLTYGIPKFRLPKEILNRAIDKLKLYNVEMVNNCSVGNTITVDELLEGQYSAVYIASGAGLPKFMNIKGEGLAGVYCANEFLTRINLMNAHSPDYDTPLTELGNVVVIGGGNVAMDAARCARRISSGEITVMYRRGEDEMPARLSEIKHAKEENIKFEFFKNPVEFIGDNNGTVRGLKYQNMRYGDIDDAGRKAVVPVSEETHKMSADTIIIAIGSGINSVICGSTPDLECDKFGKIIIKKGFTRTSKPFVYAGGDAVIGAATVISAIDSGKKAALEIYEDLSGELRP